MVWSEVINILRRPGFISNILIKYNCVIKWAISLVNGKNMKVKRTRFFGYAFLNNWNHQNILKYNQQEQQLVYDNSDVKFHWLQRNSTILSHPVDVLQDVGK